MTSDSKPDSQPKTWDDALVSLFKLPSAPKLGLTSGPTVAHPDDYDTAPPIYANPPPEEFAPKAPVVLRPMPGSQLPNYINTPWGLRYFGGLFADRESLTLSPGQTVGLNASRGALFGMAAHTMEIFMNGPSVFDRPRRLFLPWYTPKYFNGAVKDVVHIVKGGFWGGVIFGSASLAHQTVASMRGDDDGIARAAGGATLGLAYGFFRGMMSTVPRVAIPFALFGYLSKVSVGAPGVEESIGSYIPVSYSTFGIGEFDRIGHQEKETWPPSSWDKNSAQHSWKPPAVHEPGTPIKFA